MMNAITSARTRAPGFNPCVRGYHVLYRENEINRCPGCGRTHWYVGRVSAECGFCATALPLAEATARGMDGPYRGHNPIVTDQAA